MDSQSVREYMLEQSYKPMTLQELQDVFGLRDADERAALDDLFARMEEEGLIVKTRLQQFAAPERVDLVAGKVQVKERGFGFVVPLYRDGPDIFVSAADLGGAMDGDTVLVRQRSAGGAGRLEGEVVRVVRRNHSTVVGVLHTHGGFGMVRPDDRHMPLDVFIAQEELNGAVDGHKVVVQLLEYPDRGMQNAAGRVVEVLGFPDDPGVDILSIVRKYGLAERFQPEVLQAAEAISDVIDPAELLSRRDLRRETIVTIDGADAKDLDDAVHVRRLENGNYLLGVHIADVSYYVREGSPLDEEAFSRGTSVYLVDRVIPMLPPRLSNGICSLHPQVDRLTLTCEMEWSPTGSELVRHDIYASVIRTTERMTYDAVHRVLSGDRELRERYAPLVASFELMEELAAALRARRMARGAVDFDFAETKIRVDEGGHPTEIQQRERNVSERIIEEFMLAANETVAEHFFWLDIPSVYRVHEKPTQEKMTALNEFVHNFGYHLKAAGDVHPRALQELLEAVRGRAEEFIISHVVLRSMKQARYSEENLGHFGLAATYYTHFTSPIRRYPDLVVHRIVRDWLTGGLTEARVKRLQALLPGVAAHASDRERVAVDAERETDLVKKIEYMSDKIGEEFLATISGVTGFGVFVELDNSIEGLVHISYLDDDYYHYHENLRALIGERFRRMYRIGDRVIVRVLTANKEQLGIDFSMVAKVLDVGSEETELAAVRAGELPEGWRKGARAGGGRGRRQFAPPSVQAGGAGNAGKTADKTGKKAKTAGQVRGETAAKTRKAGKAGKTGKAPGKVAALELRPQHDEGLAVASPGADATAAHPKRKNRKGEQQTPVVDQALTVADGAKTGKGEKRGKAGKRRKVVDPAGENRPAADVAVTPSTHGQREGADVRPAVSQGPGFDGGKGEGRKRKGKDARKNAKGVVADQRVDAAAQERQEPERMVAENVMRTMAEEEVTTALAEPEVVSPTKRKRKRRGRSKAVEADRTADGYESAADESLTASLEDGGRDAARAALEAAALEVEQQPGDGGVPGTKSRSRRRRRKSANNAVSNAGVAQGEAALRETGEMASADVSVPSPRTQAAPATASSTAAQPDGPWTANAARDDSGKGAEKRARAGRRRQGETPQAAAAVASALRPRSLLKARGGYETPGAISASERKREERRRDSAKLQEIAATYGVQVKDKSRRQKKQDGAKQVKGPVS